MPKGGNMDKLKGAKIEFASANDTLKRYILSNFYSAYVHDMLVIRFDRAARNLASMRALVNTPG